METVVNAICKDNSIRVIWEKEGATPFARIKEREIHIPVICCSQTLDEESKENLRADCFHELGHILYSSDIKEQSCIFKIWNAIEDLWIEDKISKEYVGIGISINNSNRNIFVKISEKKDGKINSGFSDAILYLMFSEINLVPKWDIDEKTINMIESAYPIFSKWKESLSSEDNLALAKQIFELWKDEIKDLESNDNGKTSKEGTKPDCEEGDAEKTDNISGSEIKEERNNNISSKVSALKLSGEVYTAYRDEDVFEVVNPFAFLKEKYRERKAKLGKPLLSLVSSIQEKMEAVVNNSVISGLESGNINTKMLPEIAFSLRKDVFTDIHEGLDLNTAVSICVDQSYSMCNVSKYVIDTMIVLGETLHRIEVPFEIFGSSTKTPRNKNFCFTRWRSMVFSIYKKFEDNWNSVGSTVMNYHGIENHIDGEAISYAVSNLSLRKEKRKIIFVITDGETFSGQDEKSDEKVSNNLSRVLSDARKNGIEVYALSIDCGNAVAVHYGKEYVSEINSSEGNAFSKTVLTKIADIVTRNRGKA